MPRRTRPEHVPTHLAWAYLTQGGELSDADRIHILNCESCLQAFRICLKSNTFAEVITAMEEANKKPA